MPKLLFHPEIDIDIKESYLWYNEQKYGLGDEFMEELETFYSKIEFNPDQYTKIDTEIGLRACLLKCFPFKIIYKEYSESVFVVAVAHTSRLPNFWINRIS